MYHNRLAKVLCGGTVLALTAGETRRLPRVAVTGTTTGAGNGKDAGLWFSVPFGSKIERRFCHEAPDHCHVPSERRTGVC